MPDHASQFCERERVTIGRLATLLANGVRVPVGERFPDGWDGRRRRKHSICSPEYKIAAHRLLREAAPSS